MLHVHGVRLNAAHVATLVHDAQSEKSGAIDQLLRTVRPALFRYFRRHLPPDVAEDLAQLALIRISRALPRIDAARAQAFISRVAQNLLRSAYKRRHREAMRHVATIDVDEIESRTVADGEVEWHEVEALVRSAVERVLPRELRETMLALLHGQSHAEIALSQGVSQITVRTRLLRARMLLRMELRLHVSDGPTRRAVNGSSPGIAA
jgi:RNA polymerase sigma factor (sigma-70 family)